MRLIDADAMIKSMLKEAENLPDNVLHEEALVIATAANYLKGYLQRAQTVDAVSVIRCKDCRHYRESLSTCDYVAHYDLSSDDFCSNGEPYKEV